MKATNIKLGACVDFSRFMPGLKKFVDQLLPDEERDEDFYDFHWDPSTFSVSGGAPDDSLRGFSSTEQFLNFENDLGYRVETIDGYPKRLILPDGTVLKP